MAAAVSPPPAGLPADYASARKAFLAACRGAGASVRSIEHPLQGPDGEIFMDVAALGPADATRAVFVVSGTHGVEGYAGSPLQTHWLANHAAEQPANVRSVWLHAHNPYGFAWTRRVNEDNVDLNRNYLDWDDPSARPVPNTAYDELASLIVPEDWSEGTQRSSTEALLAYAAEHGMDGLQAAVSQGQYAHPKGVFYGGTGPTWSYERMREITQRELAGLERVAVIDLHTGLGDWGEGEIISHHAMATDAYRRAAQCWTGVRSMVDGGSVSARLYGDWLERFDHWMAGTEVTSGALEYGTVDLVSVLQSLRADAWLHGYGDPQGEAGEAVRRQVRAAFADDDPAWVAKLWPRFTGMLEGSFAALAAR
ncbi:MAG: M14 family metallopeptidase [Pseudomonadales bacterium]|jgi:hypothetical protein|nr:M14 family metallopeptidase [Pseudomonadales bacterium]